MIGQSLPLNQHNFTIIGVAPAAFFGTINGLAFDVWVPLPQWSELTGTASWLESRSSRPLYILARLAPETTLATARAELASLAQQLALAHPESNRGIGIALMPLRDSPRGAQRELAQPLLLLVRVCLLVLLIVCANLANLLFVRASARQRR